MATCGSALAAPTWDPLQCCSLGELSRIDERFDLVLRNTGRLVFWTGLSPELARRWAEQHGIPTLTLAMGPLYSDRGTGSVRFGKSPKAWSKYMKGASGRFAEFACRADRQAVVLTNPPPAIYSTRKRSNYRDLEEPILKGVAGGTGTSLIEYVHPTIIGATTFHYETWPSDQSDNWHAFFRNLRHQELYTHDISDMFETNQVSGNVVKDHKLLMQDANNLRIRAEIELKMAQENKQAGQKSKPQRTQEKKAAKRRRLDLEHGIAREKKEARRKRAEMELQRAKKEREAKKRNVELEQRIVYEKKEAKRKKVELQQQVALEKKEAKRKKVEFQQQKARVRREARRKDITAEHI